MIQARRISLILLLIAGIAPAAEVTVGVTMAGAPAEKRPVRIVATSSATDVAPVTATTATGDHATLSLKAGVWYVAAEGKGLWSLPLPLVVADAPLAASITTYPAATLNAKITLPKGAAPAREATITFQPTPADDVRVLLPSSSVTCPIADGRIACDVPAGVLDLSIHVSMHVPIYRWGLAAAATTDLGTLTFRRGASVSGTVEMPRGRVLPKIEVVLTPLTATGRNEREKERDRITALRTRANERGFFLLVAAPGDYRIEAKAEGLISTSRPVRIIDGAEAQLREPLRLAPPRVVSLRVDPPHDPWGKPWTVDLERLDRDGLREWKKSVPLPLTGTWQSPGLPPGNYYLYIRRRPDDAWYSTTIEITDDDQTVEARIDVTQVAGKITLGGKPLRANLWFGGKVAGLSVPLHSREDGTFRMMLPAMQGDVWKRVDIESPSPFVKRTVDNVRLERSDDSPIARVTIDLPATSLEGHIVDENGAAVVAAALVDITDAEKQTLQIPTKSATFSVAALAPGPARLRASTHDSESDPVVVNIAADQDMRVTLTLKPRTVFTGVVRSQWGPAAHAAVVAQTMQPGFYFFPYAADEGGQFKIPLPPATHEVRGAVYAPGFAVRLLRMRPQADPVTVLVDQTGGSLTVEIPDGGDAMGYLLHNDVYFPAFHLAWMAHAERERAEEGRQRFTFPLVEEGVYSLCVARPEEAAALVVTPERCATGVVARHGSLTLVAPRSGSSNLTTASTLR